MCDGIAEYMTSITSVLYTCLTLTSRATDGRIERGHSPTSSYAANPHSCSIADIIAPACWMYKCTVLDLEGSIPIGGKEGRLCGLDPCIVSAWPAMLASVNIVKASPSTRP